MESRALEIVEALRPLGAEAAVRVARAAWRQLSVEERALIASDWSFWFRQKQFPPPGTWGSWGFLGARGIGKTTALSYFVNQEVEAGRARLIGLCAQDEQSAKDIQIHGPDGLIASAPPWFKPTWEASELQLVWPNGARAYVRTPEVPGKIRGLQYHLFWASELQSWPNATREEAWSMIELSTRLGLARVLWDATPKRRHPLLKARLAENERDPKTYVIVRGATRENAANLGEEYYAKLQRKYAGTQKGREELEGEMLEESDLALVKQAWIDAKRRPRPDKFVRRVVSVDPAVTNRKGSDTTGIVEVGLGTDSQAYVLRDASGKYDIANSKWAELVLDIHEQGRCDLVIAETNKGGDLVVATLRLLAPTRGLEVVQLGKDERPPARIPGKVFVRNVYARGAKEERAEPVATAYERGRISHVAGADLGNLEDTLTTWEPAPSADSPGDLDALVHAVVELLGLADDKPDPKAGFVGLAKAAEQLQAPTKTSSIARLFTTSRGDRI